MTDYLALAQARAPQLEDQEQDNPYLPLARERQSLQQNRVRTTLETALKGDPDTAAERLRISQQSGVPLRIVERNLDEIRVKEQARMVDLAAMAQESPVLYRQLTDPTFASTAVDDIGTLNTLERALLYTVDPTKKGLASDLGAAAKTVGLGMTVGIGKMAFDVAAVVNDLIGWDEGAAGMRTAAKRAQESIDYFGFQGGTSTRNAIKSGLQSSGTNLALLPAGLMRGLYSTASQAASTVAGMMAAGVGADAFNRAREQGRNELQAGMYAIPEAAFEYVFERIPASKLFGDIAANTGLLKTLGKQAVSEGWTEQVTTLAQDFNEWMNLNPNKTLGEFIQERPEAAYQTFVATLVGVGVQTSTIKSIDKIVERASNQRLQFEQDALNEQLKLAGQSMLRTRSPEQFRAHVQQVVDENPEAKSEVFIDAEVLNQMPAELLAQLPESVREQIPGALETRSVVAIPMADVLTIAPGTPLEQALNDNARMTPDAPSKAEAQLANDMLRQDAERVLAQAADQDAWSTSAETVKSTILDQLNTAGRFTPDVNEAYATLVRDFYSVTASRAGMTPDQMYARYPLRVGAQGQTAGTLDQRDPGTWYHGTTSDVQKFTRVGGGNMWGSGYYLTDNPDTASGYAEGTAGNRIAPEGNAAPNVMPVRVAAGDLFEMAQPVAPATIARVEKALGQSLKDYTWPGMKNRDLRQVLFQQFTTQDGANTILRKAGFKGLVESNPTAGPGRTLMVFDAKDISSDITGETLAQSATPLPAEVEVDGKMRPTLNSNGQPIAATQEGVANFWRWFGDSKVVDAEGRPLVVYHGTDAEFTEFAEVSGKKVRLLGDGFYFTSSKDQATSYGKRVVGAYLKIENPRSNLETGLLPADSPDFDGVVATGVPGTPRGQFVYVARTPTQIKSAAGNSGAFNGQDANILRQSATPSLDDVRQQWTDAGIKHSIIESRGRITLSQIIVPQDERSTGKGTAAMQALVDYADRTGQRIELTPSSDFGGNKKRLTEFYKRFGFVENKGRNKDFEISEGMYREPAALAQDAQMDEATGLPLNPDGTVTVYHHTSADKAAQIAKTGKLKAAAEPDVYVTTRKETDTGYGDTAVAVRVKPDLLQIDDEFPDGRTDYRISTGKPGGQIAVRVGEYPAALNQQARGTYNPQTLLITLGENSDLSTFLHESGHFFLEVMADLASQPNAPAGVAEDMGKVLAWFGIKGNENVGGPDAGGELAQGGGMRVIYRGTNDSGEKIKGGIAEGTLFAAADEATAKSYAGGAGRVERIAIRPGAKILVEGSAEYAKLTGRRKGKLINTMRKGENLLTASNEVAEQARAAGYDAIEFTSMKDMGIAIFNEAMFVRNYEDQLAQGGNAPTDSTQPAGRTPLEVWNAMTLDQKRQYHERWAESFEQYLLEGKAPSAELQPLFRRFRSWLVNVYKSLTHFMRGRDLKLNDEIRQVFDRLVATDEQIAQAEETAGMLPDFDATNEAIEKLTARSLRDLKWAVNARNKKIRELQKQAKELRKDVEAEVTAEVNAMPVFQAQDAIARIKGDPTEQQLETIAEAYGYSSSGELMLALNGAGDKAATIEGMTDQRMLERHGDLVDQRAIEDAATEAVHNDARARALATELKAQADALNPREQTGTSSNNRPVTVNALVRAAKEFAENLTARRRVKDLKSAAAQHRAAEARASKAWQKATADGKTREAVQAKRDQLLNNYTAKAMMEAQGEVDKIITYAKKFEKDSTRKRLPPEYLDQIDALLENMDLRKSVTGRDLERRASLRKWVESQRAIGLDPIVPDSLMDDAQRVSYKEMTLDELRAMYDVVRNIEHLGRLKSKLLAAKDQREFDAVANAWADEIRANGGKPKPVKLEGDSRLVKFFKGAWADHRKLNSLIRQFAGGADNSEGFKALIRSMNERGTQEDVMIEKAAVDLAEIHAPIEKLPGGFSGAKLYIPEIRNSLTRAGRLAVALNWGNEQNRQRVRDGDNWTDAQVDAILRTLTPTELKFVNDVWEYLDSYWPEIKAKQERVSGVVEDKVAAEPFVVTASDGTEVAMRGGYYPIKYDGDRSLKSQKQEAEQLAKDMLRGAILRPTTRRGHTQARADSVVGRPVRKDLSVITQHVTQVVHDLAWHEWAVDANRLMNDPRIAGAIRDYYGAETHRAMTDAVEAIVVGDVAKQTSIDQLLLKMRANVTRSIMGASLTTALLQPFGLTQSMARIGVLPVLKGAGRWAGDAARMENTVKWVGEKSDFMRLRSKTFNRELREISQRVQGKSKIAQVADASLFMLMQKMQLIADVPTWVGAYEKALNEGADEATAVQLADEAVLSSQGGGNTRDLSAVQRELPFLTQFYSYFNTTLQLVAESTAATDFKNPRAAAGWVGDMLLLAVIPAILPALITFALKGGGDDDEPVEWAKRLAEWQASYMLGMFVGLRELPALWSPFDYGGPPAAKLINDGRRFVQQANQGEVDDQAVLATIGFLGTALGIPTTQIIRSYKGWKAWDEGDAPATSILFGPPPKD